MTRRLIKEELWLRDIRLKLKEMGYRITPSDFRCGICCNERTLGIEHPTRLASRNFCDNELLQTDILSTIDELLNPLKWGWSEQNLADFLGAQSWHTN